MALDNNNEPQIIEYIPKKTPALIILFIAVSVFIFSITLSFFSGYHKQGSTSLPDTYGGTQAIAFSKLINKFPEVHQQNISIPQDVLDYLLIPAKCIPISATANISQEQDYKFSMETPLTPEKLISFFELSLSNFGWKKQSAAPAGLKSFEIVGQYPSQDGYYWDAALRVYSIDSNQTSTQFTEFLLELVEVHSG